MLAISQYKYVVYVSEESWASIDYNLKIISLNGTNILIS